MHGSTINITFYEDVPEPVCWLNQTTPRYCFNGSIDFPRSPGPDPWCRAAQCNIPLVHRAAPISRQWALKDGAGEHMQSCGIRMSSLWLSCEPWCFTGFTEWVSCLVAATAPSRMEGWCSAQLWWNGNWCVLFLGTVWILSLGVKAREILPPLCSQQKFTASHINWARFLYLFMSKAFIPLFTPNS